MNHLYVEILAAATAKALPLNGVLAFALAVLVYPGLVAAVIAAWALSWARQWVRAITAHESAPTPLHDVAQLRAAVERDTVTPDSVPPRVVIGASIVAAIFPLLALLLLPLPGNPLVASFGLTGDLVVEAGLLLGVPITRLFVGWIVPSPFTRLAADRGARLLAGIAVVMIFAFAANAEQFSTLGLAEPSSNSSLPTFALLTRVLAALAFVFTLPALARMSALRPGQSGGELLAGELTEVSGADFAGFRLAEAFQLVAVVVVFTAAFVLPLFPAIVGTGRTLLWVAGIVLTTVGIGAWEGFTTRSVTPAQERPPLTYWLGVPLLVAMLALVAAAWAARGV
jgi:formate hydrogenlyase subunit 4